MASFTNVKQPVMSACEAMIVASVAMVIPIGKTNRASWYKKWTCLQASVVRQKREATWHSVQSNSRATW